MGVDEPFSRLRVLLVAAHPDDEVIGAGAQFENWRGRLDILHVTDGAPANPADALNAGCALPEEYRDLRRREVLDAVSLAGVPASNCRQIGVRDQQASFELNAIIASLVEWIVRLRPGIVLTHPYEGGHPDHDACALASQAAVRLASSRTGERACIWEFTSYHSGRDGIETGCFLPNSVTSVLKYKLSPECQRHKREMLARFRSQQHMLVHFGVETELFRRAPDYNFAEPPHPGRLHYENFDWGITGPRWRELAQHALKQLELVAHATNHS